MDVPSGRKLDDYDIALITYLKVFGFVRHSDRPFTLKSGVKSHVYVFGREDLTDNPEFLHYLGQKMAWVVYEATLPLLTDDNGLKPCLIGIPTAGTPLAQAAAMSAYYKKSFFEWEIFHRELPKICFRVMREELKTHGAPTHQSWINGRPRPKHHRYWMVDNVATDGASKLETAKKWAQSGYPDRPPVLIFIDRGQGAIQNLQRAGFEEVHVAYHLLDIAHCYGALRL